jgi:hypothetical protein
VRIDEHGNTFFDTPYLGHGFDRPKLAGRKEEKPASFSQPMPAGNG